MSGEQTSGPLRYLRKDLANLEAYKPIKPLEVLAEEIGVPVDKLVKLDANENLYGPIPEIIQAMSVANHHIYPDPAQLHLRTAIARYMNVPIETVVAGTGSDEILDVIIRIVDPEAIIINTPTFGMYSFLAKINKSRVVDLPRSPAPAFDIDIPAIAQAVEREHAGIVFLASPNNPTGNALTLQQVEDLCQLNSIIVIDEAYAEFSASASAVSLLPKYSNLIILRTFSKWAGLAGLRVGYGVAHPELIQWIMAIKQPYNVSSAADAAAQAALLHIDRVMVDVNKIKEEKKRLFDLLSGIDWLRPLPSDSNFMLVHVTGRLSAADLAAELRKVGVLVRYFSQPAVKDFIRISVGRPQDTDFLIQTLTNLSQ